MAAQWVWGKDHEVIAFCECDKFCQKVLKKHWPDVPICEDIRSLNETWIMGHTKSNRDSQFRQAHSRENSTREMRPKFADIAGGNGVSIDLLTGGFPCQPYSVAGKQLGDRDDRALWPEMLRVIKEVRPRWVIGENVAGFVNMALDESCSGLELEGYEVQPYIIPACAINAPHRRDRVWIVACDTKCRSGIDINAHNSTSSRQQRDGRQVLSLTESSGFDNNSWEEPWFEVATRLCRVDDGIPRKLDRVNRLKSLGNAIVPQVAAVLMQAIKELEKFREKDGI